MTTYAWDPRDRLLSVDDFAEGRFTFTYNAAGQRVKRETPDDLRKFVYDRKTPLLETTAADLTTLTYDYALRDKFGDLVSRRLHDDTTEYHAYDALGSTDSLLDAAESVTDSYVYRAFGQVASHAGSSDNRQTYVGKYGYFAEAPLGICFLNARYYDFATGQFISRDPVGLTSGAPNRYRYVNNNPINAVDPTGLFAAAPPPDLPFAPGSPPLEPWPMPPTPPPEIDLGSVIEAGELVDPGDAFWPFESEEQERMFVCSFDSSWSPKDCDKDCPCPCTWTEWGWSYDDGVLQEELGKLHFPGNVKVEFVDLEEGGYSLTCPAVNVETGQRGLFVFITNQNTCQALALLAHEAVHVVDFHGWLGRGQNLPDVTKGRKKMEEDAYTAQCQVYANHGCFPHKDGVWKNQVDACVDLAKAKELSTSEEAIGEIDTGCAGKVPTGWTSTEGGLRGTQENGQPDKVYDPYRK